MLQRISDEKAKRLAAKVGIDSDRVDQAWGRGDRRHVQLWLKDGTYVQIERGGRISVARGPMAAEILDQR